MNDYEKTFLFFILDWIFYPFLCFAAFFYDTIEGNMHDNMAQYMEDFYV